MGPSPSPAALNMSPQDNQHTSLMMKAQHTSNQVLFVIQESIIFSSHLQYIEYTQYSLLDQKVGVFVFSAVIVIQTFQPSSTSDPIKMVLSDLPLEN